jgi:hypothetical protein
MFFLRRGKGIWLGGIRALLKKSENFDLLSNWGGAIGVGGRVFFVEEMFVGIKKSKAERFSTEPGIRE